jgi:hypothetical protein
VATTQFVCFVSTSKRFVPTSRFVAALSMPNVL